MASMTLIRAVYLRLARLAPGVGWYLHFDNLMSNIAQSPVSEMYFL